MIVNVVTWCTLIFITGALIVKPTCSLSCIVFKDNISHLLPRFSNLSAKLPGSLHAHFHQKTLGIPVMGTEEWQPVVWPEADCHRFHSPAAQPVASYLVKTKSRHKCAI